MSAFEDHGSLSDAQFEAGVRDGLFALHWRAVHEIVALRGRKTIGLSGSAYILFFSSILFD